MKRRVMLTLNMQRIVQHVLELLRFHNTLEPVFDTNKPIRATADMLSWFTGQPCVPANRSHINLCVAESTWEAQAAYELDHHPDVAAWAKNDHLGYRTCLHLRGDVSQVPPRLPRPEHGVGANREGE